MNVAADWDKSSKQTRQDKTSQAFHFFDKRKRQAASLSL